MGLLPPFPGPASHMASSSPKAISQAGTVRPRGGRAHRESPDSGLWGSWLGCSRGDHGPLVFNPTPSRTCVWTHGQGGAGEILAQSQRVFAPPTPPAMGKNQIYKASQVRAWEGQRLGGRPVQSRPLRSILPGRAEISSSGPGLAGRHPLICLPGPVELLPS